MQFDKSTLHCNGQALAVGVAGSYEDASPGNARGKLNLPIAKSVISAVVNGRMFELKIPEQPSLKIMLRLDGSFEVVSPP